MRCMCRLPRRMSGMNTIRGLERRDEREVLIGPDTDVHAAGLHDALQIGNDELERVFVGDEVVGLEVAVRLRHGLHERPELGVGEPRRKCRVRGRRQLTRCAECFGTRRAPRRPATSSRKHAATARRGVTGYLTKGASGWPAQPARFVQHGAQAVRQAAAPAAATALRRSNERALLIQRHRGDVRAEDAPDAVLAQVLLDVGQVHRRHGRAVIPDVLARPRAAPWDRRSCPTTGTSMFFSCSDPSAR